MPVTRETGVQLPCGWALRRLRGISSGKDHHQRGFSMLLPPSCGALWTSSRTSQSEIIFLCIQKFSSSCLGVRTFLSVSNCLSCTSYERTVVLRKHTTLALTCPGGIVFGHFGCARMRPTSAYSPSCPPWILPWSHTEDKPSLCELAI